MDPLTGIGLAASVVQLVTCGLDAIQKCKELYQQGSVSEYSNVDYTARHLARLTESLQQSLKTGVAQSSALTNKEKDLVELARKCGDCAQRLQKELQRLQTKPRASALEASRKAALALLKGPTLRKIKGELEQFRSLLETSLLHRLSQRFDVQSLRCSEEFSNLDRRMQHTIDCLSNSRTSLSALVEQESKQVSQQLTVQVDRIEKLHIDDRVYKEVTQSLYYPEIFSRQAHIDNVFDGIQNSYDWVFDEPQRNVSSNLLQKSIEGLLRSLLYQLLSECRELIECLPTYPFYAWSERRLTAALLDLLQQKKIPLSICIFIDGLDEFDGQYDLIVKMIDDLADQKNVKVCVSSRPLLIFEEAFVRKPKLRLQDLTFESIQAYVDIQLSESIQEYNKRFRQENYGCLISNIAHRAEGVFLWAVVAVKSVRDGLQDLVESDQLEQGIEALPLELEDLFMLMLNRIKPIYRRDAAKFLQISLYREIEWSRWKECSQQLTLYDSDLNLIRMYLYSIQKEIEGTPFFYEKIAESELIENCNILKARLLSHTAGLLTVGSKARDEALDHISDTYNTILDTKVEFIHRMAREFLLYNKEAKAFLTKYGSPEARIRLSIARGLLALIEQFPPESLEMNFDNMGFNHFMGALHQISLAEELTGAAQPELMHSLPYSTMLRAQSPIEVLDNGRLNTSMSQLDPDLVKLATYAGITSYVRQKLHLTAGTQNCCNTFPDLETYSRTKIPAGIIISWYGSEHNFHEKIHMATSQCTDSYRQAICEFLYLWIPSESYLSTKRQFIQQSLVESYILQACSPVDFGLLRALLHAGANPMVQCGSFGQMSIWEKWLRFLFGLRNDHLHLKGRGVRLETGDFSFTDIFDMTKLFLVHGADINHWVIHGSKYQWESNSSLSRPFPPYVRRVLTVETSAMFVLEEWFGSEPEFRSFATAIQPLVEKPTRRIISIYSVFSIYNMLYSPTSLRPNREESTLLWPLIEQWEQTGYHRDMEALQLALEGMYESLNSLERQRSSLFMPSDIGIEKMLEKTVEGARGDGMRMDERRYSTVGVVLDCSLRDEWPYL